MLDFASVINTPGYDVQYFNSDPGNWLTWKKPRGCKMVYMLGVGGGSSGGCALNTSTSSGGGAGGGSGVQTTVLIPAFFVPDILYIQCGAGGQQPATLVSAAIGVAGGATWITVVPDNSVVTNNTVAFLYSAGGSVTGTAAGISVGGLAGGSAAAATPFNNMFLSSRGITTSINGQLGSNGGNNGIGGSSLTIPNTGLMVTGGTGGAGCFGAGSFDGGAMAYTGTLLGQGFFDVPSTGGAAAVGATPATSGMAGYVSANNLMNYGGLGGGSCSPTVGGIAGAGGNGAPGCGGGGAGGSSTVNPALARPGNGGDGFVYIVSW